MHFKDTHQEEKQENQHETKRNNHGFINVLLRRNYHSINTSRGTVILGYLQEESLTKQIKEERFRKQYKQTNKEERNDLANNIHKQTNKEERIDLVNKVRNTQTKETGS